MDLIWQLGLPDPLIVQAKSVFTVFTILPIQTPNLIDQQNISTHHPKSHLSSITFISLSV
jgi:hypothetical protein